MSYCRFQNTAGDLGDCQKALEALLNAEGEPLSLRELEAAQSLVRGCLEIARILAERLEAEVEDLVEKPYLADDLLAGANTNLEDQS